VHPSEELLHQAYECFARGDTPAFLALCDDAITFHQVPGTTPFSGTHTKADFADWIGTVMQICGGSFGERPVVIVANDEHGVVDLDHRLERDGRRIEYRVDHIWGIGGGKLTSCVERPGDEDAFNRAWS
jgi:ketosteroid isomerase-like protein